MILPESRTKEWLSEIVSKYKFRDQALIEKTIRAFSLLEALARSGLDFVFRFNGEDKYTTKESDRLFRLPMFYGLKEEEREDVCEKVFAFFGV